MAGLVCGIGWALAAVLGAALFARRRPGPRPPSARAEQRALVGELAAAVAHEIKNPLAPIRGYAQMMTDRLHHVDAAERALFAKGLGVVQAEVDRIDRQVKTLLGAASVADPDATCDLAQLVGEAADLAAAVPGIVQVRVDGPATGEARGDPDAIRGALLNLVVNAAEAMAPTGGGALSVTWARSDGEWVVEVVDEGPGLPEALRGRALEPFASTKPGGTGLGLAIARGAARAAGGRLELEDRPDGVGAVARLVLPAG